MIEYEITNINECPPGEWTYTQPETGRTFRHISYQSFLDSIRSHRAGNGLPISADFAAEIQDALVRKHPEWVQLGIAQRIKPAFKVRRFTFAGTVSFLQMLYTWVKDGSPMVEQVEAERRAAICQTCPYNQKVAWGCGTCFQTVMNTIAKVVGDRHTSVDNDLGSCGICSCSLKAAVHFPIEAQTYNLNEEIKNDLISVPWCWKGQGLKELE